LKWSLSLSLIDIASEIEAETIPAWWNPPCRAFGVRRLVSALPFPHGIFGKRRGKTVNIPLQFQVKSAGQTNVVPRAELLEKESGDKSPHSKGRLFRDWRKGPASP